MVKQLNVLVFACTSNNVQSLMADADLSQEQELRGMVAKSLSSLETFGSVSE